MNVLQKLPLIKIAALVLMVAVITGATAFAETYSWFVEALPVNETVTMGTVDIEFDGNKITNKSNIDIYLRSRVIVEWTKNGEYVLEQPDSFNKPDVSGWQWIEADGGLFLAYASDYNYTKVLSAVDEISLRVPNITAAGWEATVTLIPEAIQADGGAAAWTAGDGKGRPGVRDWKAGGMHE